VWFAPDHVSPAREQIVRILQSLTDISAAELGRRVGVSRERVRQILRDLGYPTARGRGRPYGPLLLGIAQDPAAGRLDKRAAVGLVVEDLLAKGFGVFAPVGATGDCALIGVTPGGAVNLITVCLLDAKRKRGRRARESRRVRRAGWLTAWVSQGAPVRYDPPLKERRARPH
jgi:hypothetical protein